MGLVFFLGFRGQGLEESHLSLYYRAILFPGFLWKVCVCHGHQKISSRVHAAKISWVFTGQARAQLKLDLEIAPFAFLTLQLLVTDWRMLIFKHFFGFPLWGFFELSMVYLI